MPASGGPVAPRLCHSRAVTTNWQEWHRPYDDPGSALSRRLRVVQGHLADWLDRTAPAPVRVLSLCSGDGRDLLEVLSARPDSARVEATLVELDPGNAARAEAAAAGLDGVTVRVEDAGVSDAFRDAVPADLVLLAGVFGNVSDQDVLRTVRTLPQLCASGATVLWTRHRREPDLTPAIRSWLAETGFAELAFDAPDDVLFGVGVHRFEGSPEPWVPGLRLFSFTR